MASKLLGLDVMESHDDLTLTFQYDPATTEEWVYAHNGEECVAKLRLRRTLGRVVIKFLTVHPAYRRRGIARFLVSELQRYYEEIQAQSVTYQARGFWSRIGFFRDDKLRHYSWTQN